jgi:uncharacterized protein YndB with AHSA1/START domain
MGTIRIEATYPHPPERVWAALTDPAALTEWLMPNDFQPRLGHAFQFRIENPKGWSGVVDCTVTELAPLRRLAYTWSSAPTPRPTAKTKRVETTVTWTLEPFDAGTRLVLEQSGFKGVGGFLLSRLIMGPGWKRMLRTLLPKVLARVTAAGFVPDPAMAAEKCR